MFNLATYNNGITLCMFNEAMDKLLVNAKDPNCNKFDKRKITLEVVYTPNKLDEGGNITMTVKEKFATVTPSVVGVEISSYKDENGNQQTKLYELHSDQQHFDFSDDKPFKAIQGGR